jgi:hypothetical protein
LIEGWQNRCDFIDARAAVMATGELVHLDDLVLLDSDMNDRMPTQPLGRATEILSIRRMVGGERPGWALTDAGLRRLKVDGVPEDATHMQPGTLGGEGFDVLEHQFAEIDALISRTSRLLDTLETPRRSALLYDESWGEAGRLAEWRTQVDKTRQLPAMLGAAVAYDAWQMLAPVQRREWLGSIIVADMIRADVGAHSLPALYAGFREARRKWRAADPPATRIESILKAFECAIAIGEADFTKLRTARDVMGIHLRDRRKNSRMPALVALFLSRPLVTVQMAAKELGMTTQGVEALLRQLGGTRPRELTGRHRYRAWGII